MSAVSENIEKIKAAELIGLSADEATKKLGIDLVANPKHRVTGAGTVVVYKVGDEFLIPMGTRNDKLFWVTGGAVESTIGEQVKIERQEETFGKLNLSQEAKLLPFYYADSQPWGTFVTFAYLDHTSFSTKEQLQGALDELNPSAKFYNDLFSHVTANAGSRKEPLNPGEYAKNTEDLIKRYLALKAEKKLLVDVAGENEAEFLENLRSLSDIGGTEGHWSKTANGKFITDYKIGNYSERPGFKLYSLKDLEAPVEEQKQGKKAFFATSGFSVAALLPLIQQKTTEKLFGRPGSPALWQLPQGTQLSEKQPASQFTI